MSTYEANHVTTTKRPPRLWIVESLIVLGVLAFGYFAVTLDASRWTGTPPSDTVDPLVEITR
jgi:hypothetical protein